jgi:tRNA-splicing endonuclease subunit Sen54
LRPQNKLCDASSDLARRPFLSSSTMADADEDAIPSQLPSTPNLTLEDDDADNPTDEVADYTLLTTVLPRRGVKDFEPTTLSSQRSTLEASRDAMHTALSYPRLHLGKSHVVGVYMPNPQMWFGGPEQGRCVRVDNFNSGYGRSMGVGDRKNRFWLNGEEALFLLETGRCDIRWTEERAIKRRRVEGLSGEGGRLVDFIPLGTELDEDEEQEPAAQIEDDQAEEDEDDDIEASELPMSLQGAYASLIGKSELTLERYLVYAGLRRLGYTVVRAPTWSDADAGLNGQLKPHALPIELTQRVAPSSGLISDVASFIHRLVQYLFKPDQTKACPSLGPLVAPGLYRNYNDIFRALSLIPYHELNTVPQTTHPFPPFRIAYHVYKPNTPYRKTLPPPPDFRIAVVDARATSVPTLDQIGSLLDSMPPDELLKDKRLEQRLKHGRRNVILAVVDTGVVSYMRLSDAGFGSAKLFEQPKRQGAKGRPRATKVS